MIQVFTKRPTDFQPAVEVAACYCLHGGKLLLLERHPDKPQGLTWGVPCGKIELGESPLEAVKREVLEEVGLDINAPKPIGQLYMIFQTLPYIYHMFESPTQKNVTLNYDEHISYRWVSPQEAFDLPLISGGAEALKCYLAL